MFPPLFEKTYSTADQSTNSLGFKGVRNECVICSHLGVTKSIIQVCNAGKAPLIKGRVLLHESVTCTVGWQLFLLSFNKIYCAPSDPSRTPGPLTLFQYFPTLSSFFVFVLEGFAACFVHRHFTIFNGTGRWHYSGLGVVLLDMPVLRLQGGLPANYKFFSHYLYYMYNIELKSCQLLYTKILNLPNSFEFVSIK